MENQKDALRKVREWVEQEEPDPQRTKKIAESIRAAQGYRWVGIYQVTKTEIIGLAWTGTEAPAYPRFPVSQGLCGAAVQSRAAVVVADVRNDPRYLATFQTTRSEIVVPILDATGEVAGLIDVESERPNAFRQADTQFLESCAWLIRPLFARTN